MSTVLQVLHSNYCISSTIFQVLHSKYYMPSTAFEYYITSTASEYCISVSTTTVPCPMAGSTVTTRDSGRSGGQVRERLLEARRSGTEDTSSAAT